MYSIVDNFVDWLNQELRKRNWTQTDLARESGLTRGAVSNIIRQERNPDTDTLIAFAQAFGYPPETVFRIAGKLPPRRDQRREVEEIFKFKLGELTDYQLAELLSYTEFIQERDKRDENKQLVELRDYLSSVPPEEVNKLIRMFENYLESQGFIRIK